MVLMITDPSDGITLDVGERSMASFVTGVAVVSRTCGARWDARSSASPRARVKREGRRPKKESESQIQPENSEAKVTVERGTLSRRNPYWKGIPMRYARAHNAFMALPPAASVQVNSVYDLRRLRPESEARQSAMRLLHLRASDVWTYLGGAERHKAHQASLRAWRRAVGAAEETAAKRDYSTRFQLARLSNGIFLYLHMRQKMWRSVAHLSVRETLAVRLFEQGIVLGDGLYQRLFATPVASVLQRDEHDFWNWRKEMNSVLLVHALPEFRRLGGGRCQTGAMHLPSRLPARLFLEALLAAAVSDVHFADVVLFSTEGCATFRVHRSEALLKETMLMVRWFEQTFVNTLSPPPLEFHNLYRDVAQLHRTIDAEVSKCEPIDQLDRSDTSECLAPWRRRMDAWETRRSEMAFYT
ncbi:hypothetical protein BWQ96_01317 [Gracilariopsis chorda]|uniref:Uncharacterized protein n=1 Tax=Gracilariopsis chorda TaxID=448386 RepID=A0A2V3J2T5_9FLOR|nr:hypothetical protein BWQ96_01317 [Gracilariopsis chorda]|eukprot:PXF48761.1 hypothetical protein BWQ96_01317 [Gracilariopsis chorda]